MVKVCQVSSVHRTFDTRIFFKICKSLSASYDVSLISANAKDEVVDGVKIKGVRLPKSRFIRPLFLNRVYWKLIEVDAEIYQFHDPELLGLGLRMHKLGKKVIFDSHEDIPKQILGKEYLPKCVASLVSKIYEAYEKKILIKYDAVVSVTPSIVDRLKKVNPHTYQITNYPIYSESDNNAEDNRTFDRKVCFVGGIEAQWMHDKIISSVEGTDVKYVFAGPVSFNDYMTKCQKLQGWTNAEYLGVIKNSECQDLIRTCSAGMALNNYSENIGGKLGTLGNNKLFEYMKEGIPVISTDCLLWKQILDENDCGKYVNPNDVEAIRQAILYYVNNPSEARRQGNNGRQAVKDKYNWSTQAEILFTMYKNLLS